MGEGKNRKKVDFSTFLLRAQAASAITMSHEEFCAFAADFSMVPTLLERMELRVLFKVCG